MNLEASIAKLNLGELSITQFPKIAIEALIAGKDSESLNKLAGMSAIDNPIIIEQYLNKAMKELGIVSHKSLNAGFILANAYIELFKNKEIDVIECIYNIKNECWDNCQEEIVSDEYLLDGIKFEKIIGPWYEYYEIDEWTDWVKKSDKSLSQIKTEIKMELEKLILEWKSEFLDGKLRELKTIKNEL